MENISRFILLFVISLILFYLLVQRIRCSIAQRKSKERLSSYDTKSLDCSYGKMTYIDEGEGEVILSMEYSAAMTKLMIPAEFLLTNIE